MLRKYYATTSTIAKNCQPTYMAQRDLALGVTVECKENLKKEKLKFISVETMGDFGGVL